MPTYTHPGPTTEPHFNAAVTPSSNWSTQQHLPRLSQQGLLLLVHSYRSQTNTIYVAVQVQMTGQMGSKHPRSLQHQPAACCHVTRGYVTRATTCENE